MLDYLITAFQDFINSFWGWAQAYLTAMLGAIGLPSVSSVSDLARILSYVNLWVPLDLGLPIATACYTAKWTCWFTKWILALVKGWL